MTTWSYSSLKTFEQCPKKYYHLKIAKDVKDEGNQATVYGNEVHKAAEDYIKLGTPVPDKYGYMRPILDSLAALPGEKHCELKLGVAYDGAEYTPTTFFGKDVWWRGIADLTIINGDKAFLVDYKTGKNAKYADPTQLDILAAAVFTHFPEVVTIKSALAYVVSNEFIRKQHVAHNRKSYFATFDEPLEKLAVAEQTGVWNANSGPLCKFCPVRTCPHNRSR
jgi:RecB family exonuclease